MNKITLRSYGFLVQAIANWIQIFGYNDRTYVIETESGEKTIEGPFISANSDKLGGRSMWFLKDLGILLDLSDSTQIRPYKFACDIADANEISRRNFHKGPPFDVVLRLFIDVMGERCGLEIEWDSAFNPPDSLMDALNTLVDLDYAKIIGDEYVWTEKMVPTLIMCGAGPNDKETREREWVLGTKAAHAAIDRLPIEIRHQIDELMKDYTHKDRDLDNLWNAKELFRKYTWEKLLIQDEAFEILYPGCLPY